MFVKFIVFACVFKIVRDGIEISNNCLRNAIGTTSEQVAKAREDVKQKLEANSLVTPLSRKKRKDHIRDILKPHVFRYLQDDNFTRLDTNQNKADVIDPSTGNVVEVHRRIWLKEVLDRLLHLPDIKDTVVSVMVWEDAIRQGGTPEKPNTQRELGEERMTITDLVDRLRKQIDKCLPHYQEICWIRHVMDTDFKTLPPNTLVGADGRIN